MIFHRGQPEPPLPFDTTPELYRCAARRLYEAIHDGGRARSGETGDLRGFLSLTGTSYYPGGWRGLKRKSA